MTPMDEIARINRENWSRDVADGVPYTVPFLDLPGNVWDPTWRDFSEQFPGPGDESHERAFGAYFSVLSRKC